MMPLTFRKCKTNGKERTKTTSVHAVMTVQLTSPNIAVVVVHMNIGVPSVVVVSSSSGSSKQYVVSAAIKCSMLL
jgi:hypothetical protein